MTSLVFTYSFYCLQYDLSRDTKSHFCLMHETQQPIHHQDTAQVVIQRDTLRKWLWEQLSFPHCLNSFLLSLVLQIQSVDLWPVVLVLGGMARFCSIVSVILLDEGRKRICCFLCIYLQPVEANILWVVVFLTSRGCMLAWKKRQVIHVAKAVFYCKSIFV